MKSGDGIEIFTKLTEKMSRNALERYHNLFHGTPLWGCEDWENLSVDELYKIMIDAVHELMFAAYTRREHLIAEHKNKSWIIRFRNIVSGWKAPTLYTEEEILQRMIDECIWLRGSMRARQYRKFYMGFDFIKNEHKPRELADQLTMQLSAK